MTTHTYATLEVSEAAFKEIKRRIRRATGNHNRCSDRLCEDGFQPSIDMGGIALVTKKKVKP